MVPKEGHRHRRASFDVPVADDAEFSSPDSSFNHRRGSCRAAAPLTLEAVAAATAGADGAAEPRRCSLDSERLVYASAESRRASLAPPPLDAAAAAALAADAGDPAAAALPLVAALAERCAALRDERDALVARVEALEGELDGREAGLG